MKKHNFVIVVILMTVMALISQAALVSAASISEIRQQIEKNSEALEKGRSEEQSLAAQVTQMEGELARLDEAIAKGEAELEKLGKEIEEAQKKMDTQSKNLNGRLRNMYKSGNVGLLDVLLDSESISELMINYEMVKEIYRSDRNVLNSLEKAHDELEAKKKEAEELQAELEASRKVTEEQKAVIEAKKKEISDSNAKTQQMLDELEAEADRITASTESSSSTDSSYTGGEMAWPSPTCRIITSPFGKRTRPYTGFHNGIDLAKYGSAHGEPIVAANDGIVIRASWFGGYGNCVMIDHGGGVVTLYGHASRLHVSYGQRVSRGQHIADIGNTGNSFGAHLHFEVRIDKKPQNPYPYIT